MAENKDLSRYAILKSRRGDLDEMDINSYIEHLTSRRSSNIGDVAPNSDEQKLAGYEIGIYSYLRDFHHAKTVGEAKITLEQRKIDPKIVKLWIEEKMALNSMEFDAISKGYPEFQKDLERVRTDWIETIMKRRYD